MANSTVAAAAQRTSAIETTRHSDEVGAGEAGRGSMASRDGLDRLDVTARPELRL